MNEDNQHFKRDGESLYQQEKHFIVRFGIVALVIHVIILGVAGVAWAIDRRSEVFDERRDVAREHQDAAVGERIAPVGRVATDASELAALSPAAAPAPARAPLAAQQVVTEVCAACHQPGLLDAPRIGDHAAWQARLQAHGGMDALVRAALDGKGNMPPRGGRADLTEAEIRAAIESMMGQG